jgi:hypothetical protein
LFFSVTKYTGFFEQSKILGGLRNLGIFFLANIIQKGKIRKKKNAEK